MSNIAIIGTGLTAQYWTHRHRVEPHREKTPAALRYRFTHHRKFYRYAATNSPNRFIADSSRSCDAFA